MKQRILYSLPMNQETPKGVLFVDNLKFKEMVKDPEFETESEIDYDFQYMQNYVFYTTINDRMTEHNFTLNLN